MIAESAGVNYGNIFSAMTHKYPRTKNFALPGFAAGPCLLKDTMQLSAYAKRSFFLGHSSMVINEGLPNFVIEQVKKKHKLSEMRAGILGMAFKSNCDDPRDSLSYKLRKLLLLEAKEVLCSDVYIKDERFVSTNDILETTDIVFIGTPHKEYKNLDFSKKIVINIWQQIKG
mgnify:CR=1 FL=1